MNWHDSHTLPRLPGYYLCLSGKNVGIMLTSLHKHAKILPYDTRYQMGDNNLLYVWFIAGDCINVEDIEHWTEIQLPEDYK